VFRERTQRVILMGSALLEAERDELGRPTGQTVVVPDPMSSNMSEDMESADRLFRLAQELMVPLVVLSRHFTLALQVPRVLFDKLDSHGGALGKKLASAQREATRLFWIAACASPSDALLRRGLAPSCDREWFLKVFCNGVAPEGDDIWQAVQNVTVYSSLALLAVLPHVFNRFTKGHSCIVRSTPHTVVGLTSEDHGIADDQALRALIYQCLFLGTRLNASEFELSSPPPIPLTVTRGDSLENGNYWTFDERELSLDYLLPDDDAQGVA
ncbi:unnamed protein product, partial [Polarella glacialis]